MHDTSTVYCLLYYNKINQFIFRCDKEKLQMITSEKLQPENI